MSDDSIRTEMLNGPAKRAAYHLAGLRLLSDFELPGLVPWHDRFSAQDTISIERTRLPVSLAQVRAEFPYGQCNETEFLLDIPEAGRLLVRGGREILADPAPGAEDDAIRPYLLGTALGVLCHQRGIVPLHAAAIDVAGGCIAFAGDSGTGKSTLAAALAKRGYQVISDDVCYLHAAGDEGVSVWPGAGRIRLWEDSIQALSLHGAGVTRETSGYDKFLIPVGSLPDPARRRRLLGVYQLKNTAAGEIPGITRVRGAAALQTLLHNIYRMEYAGPMGRKPGIFEFCARMARQVPVFSFSRDPGFDRLQSGVDRLVEYLKGLPPV